MVRPAEKREAVEYLESQYEVSERHSCKALRIYRSAFRRQPERDEQAFLLKYAHASSAREINSGLSVRVQAFVPETPVEEGCPNGLRWIERWRKDYNEFRPHSALTYLAPTEFARIGSKVKARNL